MTNINNDNLPPIEEIREIKNQIPTFEEFMKDYKVDANLNYADLNSGDIGTPKGYGPMLDMGGGNSSSSSGGNYDYGVLHGVGKYRVNRRIGYSSSPIRYSDCEYCGRSKEQVFCGNPPCIERHNRDVARRWKWIGKTALTLGAGWFLGPGIAIKVGGLTWGTTKIVENVVEDENLKEVLNFIGNIGWDTAKGAFIGELIGAGSGTLASKTTQEIGHLAAKAIAIDGGKIAGDVRELIEIGRIISLCQKGYELKEKYEKYGGKAFCELARHEYHGKEQGRNYDSNCEICNP